ncbi:hypothetical protein [Polyangium aurulentum]|uniref:hypothetical protein n=1 Tax=Polyangium aurulentum TaxID=2567896 RepID=UPI0010AE25EE|nr:hypothetical protein [Polyangium aurulentum]UQA60655.1 hypothetical protein E8A73_009330 [Polyangium aurulentum]
MRAPRSTALFLALFTLAAACGDKGQGTGGTGGSSSSSTGDTPTSTGTGGEGGSSASSGGDATGGGGAGGTGVGGAGAGGAGTGGSGGAGTGGSGGAGGTGGTGGGAPVDGYGALSGTCGDIDLDDILSPEPELLANLLDFSARPAFDVSLLSSGGQTMHAEGNLGGSSLYSEIFAYEVLHRCDAAALLKTEAQIIYAMQGKKTDLLVEIDGMKVGVSVVRAVSYPKGNPYPVSQAYTVLEGKLADILQSSVNVDPQDAWKKQILAVVAQTPAHADAIQQAYTMIDPATKADTIVLVTVTEGDDDFIYYNSP